MRPTGLEALRGLQAALTQVIAPELRSVFAQDAVQTMQMLIESLASEWDGAAETLVNDNRRLSGLLEQAAVALRSTPALPDGAATAGAIADSLGDRQAESLALTALAERNRRLRELLERVLLLCEESLGQPGSEPLLPVRQSAYAHLREVAARGWSFWDVLSFRERMARLRSGGG